MRANTATGLKVGRVLGLVLSIALMVLGIAVVYLTLIATGNLTVPDWAALAVMLLTVTLGAVSAGGGILLLMAWVETEQSRRLAKH